MDKIIKQFYKDLVKALPMDDATFRSMLYTADLLPGDLKAKIQAMQTSAEKAEHLLDHAINNDATNFAKLLEVMNSSDNTALKKLASNIQNEIDSPSLSNGATGFYHISYYMCLSTYIMHEVILYNSEFPRSSINFVMYSHFCDFKLSWKFF